MQKLYLCAIGAIKNASMVEHRRIECFENKGFHDLYGAIRYAKNLAKKLNSKLELERQFDDGSRFYTIQPEYSHYSDEYISYTVENFRVRPYIDTLCIGIGSIEIEDE